MDDLEAEGIEGEGALLPAPDCGVADERRRRFWESESNVQRRPTGVEAGVDSLSVLMRTGGGAGAGAGVSLSVLMRTTGWPYSLKSGLIYSIIRTIMSGAIAEDKREAQENG